MFSKRFDGIIWNTILSNDGTVLLLDVRDEKKEQISYWLVGLGQLSVTELKVGRCSWWSSMEAYDGALYISEYYDQQDPNKKRFYRLGDEKEEVQKEEIPALASDLKVPFLYEHGSEYHNMVANFLGLELPLPCEYMEWKNKIIMSYYLRSGNAFDRNLLILSDGEKEYKLRQDAGMKGFASGAFFELKDYIIYIKDRNEICFYPV